MFIHRRTRLITVLFALISLLFMQLAVASYACSASQPNLTGLAKTEASAAMVVMAEMADITEAHEPCSEAMRLSPADAQPSLCYAHCQPGEQKTADTSQLPAPLCLASLPADFTLPALAPVFLGASLQAPHLLRTTAPPVSIRHCCLRI